MIVRFCFFIFLIFPVLHKNFPHVDFTKNHNYYFSINGSDTNDGSIKHPFKTIVHFNSMNLNAGNCVFFKGGETFKGNLIIDSTKSGIDRKPVIITSYGNGNAIIDAANETAVAMHNLSCVNISNLICKGAGRKKGNTKPGIDITNCNNISVNNIDISGFQKSGLQVYSCKNVTIKKVSVHDNGAAGISIEGDYNNKITSNNIQITYCTAENNPGDPTNLTNHSGNGIVAGHCTNLLIDHCMATNNGWDMPRIGNGPVGIWCYEADSVTIQHCISFRNKTSVGGADGGGFDFDGGVTNSIIQYCLSYENQGSGYCMFQYYGASPWHNNVIRFNISENDGLVSDSRADVYVWNSSGDDKQFYNCDFYNNTIYNSKQAALSFSEASQRKDFRFYNNIFVAKDSLIKGKKANDAFLANNWWSLEKKFNADGMIDFKAWTTASNIELLNRVVKGLNIFPQFKNAGNTKLTNVNKLSSFDNYKIMANSSAIQSGIDLKTLFNINTGHKDFNGRSVPMNFIGACDKD